MASINLARIWTTLVILVYGSSLLSCKRQKPRHDEIERVFNVTHSAIWKCSVSECHPGSGLSFPCGVSIPFSESIECVYCVKGVNYSETNDYSQCKSCRKCSPHEKSSGHCTTTEDSTRCLKICDKGFYWNDVTYACDPCSDCCDQQMTHHEKQCEDSGLPVSHQCQQSHVKCQHPTAMIKTTGKLFQPDDQKSNHLSSSSITGIVVSCVSLVVIIIVLCFAIHKRCDWQQVKTILKRDCCFSQGKTETVYFYNPKDNDADLESGQACSKENGSGPGHLEGANKKGLLTSVQVPAHPELPDSPAGRGHEAKSNKKPRPRKLCLPSVDNKDHSPPLTVNPASDFHGFQKHLLTRKMETIPLQPFYRNICTKLDIEQQFSDDYRLLGEKIGLSRDQITLLGQRGQPTHCMLQRFKSQKNSSVGKFKNIMEDMDRHDIVTIIDEWISYEWGKENNPAAPLV